MFSIKQISFALLASFGLASSAFATPITFDLTNPNSRNGIIDSTYASQYNYNRSGVNLSVTGWSYGTESTVSKQCTKYKKGNCMAYKNVTTTSVVDSIEQAAIGKWSGLGDEQTNSPNHAIDNENGDYDMLLLSFDELVNLNSIELGWRSNDSDVSIMAFNGSSFASSSLLGKQWQNLLSEGWQSAGDYFNLDLNAKAVNPLMITSKYWLIGAFNPLLGNANNDKNADYFKLENVVISKVVKVPEPSAVALLAMSLMGLVLVRRRKM
jgi:PEP-CTERM motif